MKHIISEGWDIPRACMLYQVRDSKSKQLDEQVLGRVRRNPRLLDFETLNDEQKRLATTAWVWGVRPDTMMARRQVSLFGGGSDIQDHFKVKSTRLENLTQKADFDIEGFIDGQLDKLEMPGMDEDDELFLWGKNYPLNSEIKYEYYSNGIHASYPDFVMKDKLGRIHIFEVKSVNVAVGTAISKEEYEKKVKDLHDLYIACSKKLPDYRFYLPIMKDDDWRIRRYYSGVFREISYEEFRKTLKEQDL